MRKVVRNCHLKKLFIHKKLHFLFLMTSIGVRKDAKPINYDTLSEKMKVYRRRGKDKLSVRPGLERLKKIIFEKAGKREKIRVSRSHENK